MMTVSDSTHYHGRWKIETHSRLVAPVMQRLEHRMLPIPLWHAVALPHDESKPHAHALTSLILFRDDGTVAKVYAPGLIPRLLYWLAFQAPFPYMRNRAALGAAVHRRNLAGMLTEYWYGKNRVAHAIGIEEIDGRFGVISERVEGTEPVHVEQARQFLFDVADHFDDVGFPSWQIDPRQPRSTGNLIERPDGTFVIIDLESGLVSPLASPRAWWRAIRRGSVPLFDEVYFDVTRHYMDRESQGMREKLGDEWLARLRSTLDAAEAAEQAWHASEPRIWRTLLRGFWNRLGMDVPRSPFEETAPSFQEEAMERPTP
jgi:hypothetical protein